MNTSRLLHFSMAAVILCQTACVGSTPPAKFYLLESVNETSSFSQSGKAIRPVLSLAKVRIPAYLDRAQIVSASAKNSYELNELHRWAEALDNNMTRVLLLNLSALVPAEMVMRGNQSAGKAEFQIEVDVLEFHVDQDGEAGLVAQWRIKRSEGLLLSRRNEYRFSASKDNVLTQVRALNRCLDQLSRDIALEMQSLIR